MCELFKSPPFYSAVAAIGSLITALLAFKVLVKNYRLAVSKSKVFFQVDINRIQKVSETLPPNHASFPFAITLKNIGENYAKHVRIQIVVYDPESQNNPILYSHLYDIAEDLPKNQEAKDSVDPFFFSVISDVNTELKPRQKRPYICVKINYLDAILNEKSEQYYFRKMEVNGTKFLDSLELENIKGKISSIFK